MHYSIISQCFKIYLDYVAFLAVSRIICFISLPFPVSQSLFLYMEFRNSCMLYSYKISAKLSHFSIVNWPSSSSLIYFCNVNVLSCSCMSIQYSSFYFIYSLCSIISYSLLSSYSYQYQAYASSFLILFLYSFSFILFSSLMLLIIIKYYLFSS